MGVQLTVDELVAACKHSNEPYIYIEGIDDCTFYSKILEELNLEYALMPCGGRNSLFQVFEQLADQPNVCFVADKDLFVINGIPEQYKNIIFTEGYSIENDLFADGEAFLIDTREINKDNYKMLINSLIEWFAFQIEMERKNPAKCCLEINFKDRKILPDGAFQISVAYLQEINFVSPAADLIESIRVNYQLKIRGKCLFAIQERLTPKEASIAEKAVINICIQQNGAYIRQLRDRISQKIKIDKTA